MRLPNGSGVSREVHAPFCERQRGKFRLSTHPKIKSVLRKYAPRTERAFNKAIKIAFNSITQDDIRGWFKHCGY